MTRSWGEYPTEPPSRDPDRGADPYRWDTRPDWPPPGSRPVGRDLPGPGALDRPTARRRRQRPRLLLVLGLALMTVAIAGLVTVALRDPGDPIAAPPAHRVDRSGGGPGRVGVTTTIPLPSTTTTTTPPEAQGLRGRPLSPVALDPAPCAGPLRPGTLQPQDFTPWVPPATPPPTLTDEQIRAEITTIMRRRFRTDDPDRAVTEALAIYDSVPVKRFAEDDPHLRAAVTELKGTIGEPALGYVLLTDRLVTIHFGQPPIPDAGGVTENLGATQRIVLRQEFQNERPALLAPIVFHELLHQTAQAQWDEELVNNVVQLRVGLEQIRDDPEMLDPPTQLAENIRWSTLAELNNRVGTDLTVTRSDAVTLFPGTTSPVVHDLPDYFRQRGPGGSNPYTDLPATPTPGNLALTQVLRSMDPSAAPANADFDDTAIAFLDTHPGVGLCDQLVVAVEIGALPTSAATRAATAFIHAMPA